MVLATAGTIAIPAKEDAGLGDCRSVTYICHQSCSPEPAIGQTQNQRARPCRSRFNQGGSAGLQAQISRTRSGARFAKACSPAPRITDTQTAIFAGGTRVHSQVKLSNHQPRLLGQLVCRSIKSGASS